MELTAQNVLPRDAEAATLIGRAWIPERIGGPSPVTVRDGKVYDLARVVATSSQLINAVDPVKLVREALKSDWVKSVGSVEALLANSASDRRDGSKPYFLAPCDLQALRACGVTFVSSMLERVIEEHAKGDAGKAEEIRQAIDDYRNGRFGQNS